MKNKVLFAGICFLHLLAFLFFLSACEGCCDDCACCTEGSPKVTSSKSTSWCESDCPSGVVKGKDDPDSRGCAAMCATFIGEDGDKKGCMDPDAVNHDPQATVDDGSCKVSGCTDKCADNMSLKATQDDGSCRYSGKCLDPSAKNYARTFENCGSKVPDDKSKCDYGTKPPDPINPDIKTITVHKADWCVTRPSLANVTSRTEVTFRVEYTYTGSQRLFLTVLNNGAACTGCDSPKQLSAGQNLQTYSQYIIGNEWGDAKFTVRLSTKNPLPKSGEALAEETVDRDVVVKVGPLLTASPLCNSMVEGEYKPLGNLARPRKPNITKVELASGKLSVTVKHDVREASLLPGSASQTDEKHPDYYVVGFDDYEQRSAYKVGNAVDMDAWYKAVTEGGKGKVKVFEPAKGYPDEETFALDAEAGKTYAVFVKAVNITYPYATPPSRDAKVLAAEGSELAHVAHPKPAAILAMASRDRMLKATVTIPSGASDASLTLKSASENLGTFGNLLGEASSRSYHIYEKEADIFADEEYSRQKSDAYVNQRVILVKDPSNPRKFDVYAVFNALEAVTLDVSLDGVPSESRSHTLSREAYFAEWIDFADNLISAPAPPVVVSALAKRSAGPFKNPGLTVRSLIWNYGYGLRIEISFVLGLYDGIKQGIIDDATAAAGMVGFFKDPWTNASNLWHVIREEAANMSAEKIQTVYRDLTQNLHAHLHSEADRNIPFAGYEDTDLQVKLYMIGYVSGYLVEQVYLGIVVARGFTFAGRGIVFALQTCKNSALVLEGVTQVTKWRTAVVFFASRPLVSAQTIARNKLAELHKMIDNLLDALIPGSSQSYGEMLSGYADQGGKIDGLGKAAGYDWAVKGELTLKRLVDFNEALARDGLPKLSEKGAEGVLALYPYVVAVDRLDPQFVSNFLETYRAFDGKILREAIDMDFEKFTEVPIHNDKVRLGSAITQADLDEVVRVVRGWQGREDYPGVDAWQGKVLKKGTRIWAGQPGLSGFFVSDQAMQAAAGDVAKLYQGCQIKAHPKHGPRVIFTAFELTEDAPIAESLALANPEHGPGGMLQYYLQNWPQCLKAVETRILVNPNPLEP